MIGEPIRRPVRAFLLTPPIFLVIYALVPVVLTFIDQPHSNPKQALTFSLIILFYGAPFAYFGAIIMGVPAFFILKNTRFETALICMFLTALAATIVYFFLEVDIMPPPDGTSYSFGDGSGKIIENNVRTAYGWHVLLKTLGQTFLYGAFAGLVFWRLYSGKWWGRIMEI